MQARRGLKSIAPILDAPRLGVALPLGQARSADKFEVAATDVGPRQTHESFHPESLADILDITMPTTVEVALPPSTNRLWAADRSRFPLQAPYLLPHGRRMGS